VRNKIIARDEIVCAEHPATNVQEKRRGNEEIKYPRQGNVVIALENSRYETDQNADNAGNDIDPVSSPHRDDEQEPEDYPQRIRYDNASLIRFILPLVHALVPEPHAC
jgi:hypothetical protein